MLYSILVQCRMRYSIQTCCRQKTNVRYGMRYPYDAISNGYRVQCSIQYIVVLCACCRCGQAPAPPAPPASLSASRKCRLMILMPLCRQLSELVPVYFSNTISFTISHAISSSDQPEAQARGCLTAESDNLKA